MTTTPKEASSAQAVDVVIIDGEDSVRESFRQSLEGKGYRTATAKDGPQGLDLVEKMKPKLVLLDLRLQGMGGMEVLQKIRAAQPQVVPIVVTGQGSIETAVQAMKLGAFDFLPKPIETARLLERVDRGIRAHATPEAKPAAAAQKPGEATATAREVTEPDVLLKGLEVLGQYYSLGIEHRTLAEELDNMESEARRHAERLGQIRQKEKVVNELVADFRLVDEVVEKNGFRKNALIQVLLEVQAKKRWLPQHVIAWVSRRLNVPVSRVYEVATFYEAFSLVPQGEHTIQVCMGTSCHVRHAPELATTVSAMLGIKPGETDANMTFTLKEVHCLGCCALAPVLKIDDTYYGNPQSKDLRKIFEGHQKKGEA